MPLTDQNYVSKSVDEIRDLLIDDLNTRLSPAEPIVYRPGTNLSAIIDTIIDSIVSTQKDAELLIHDATSADNEIIDNVKASFTDMPKE